MSWYYVKNNQRIGPVSTEKLQALKQNGTLKEDGLVWKKGLDNWKKLSEVEGSQAGMEDTPDIPPLLQGGFDWESVDNNQRLFTIKTGMNTESSQDEYGPYSADQIRQFFKEKRINGKTLIFAMGMDNWKFLAETPLFKKISRKSAPIIGESERRMGGRRPFVARILFFNKATIFEGVCNDVSIGGMQVLIADFPGKVGEQISLNVHPDNSNYNFAAKGKIVRFLKNKQGFSIKFLKLDQKAKKSINLYIQQNR